MAHVFETVAEEINLLVDDEEAVVYLVGQLDGLYGGLLAVVGFEGFVVFVVVGGVDGCFYACGSLVEECEGLVVTIIIYEDDLLFGGTDEVGDVGIGVPHAAGGKELTIVFFLRTSAIFKHWLGIAFGLASVPRWVAGGYGRGRRLVLRSVAGGLRCVRGGRQRAAEGQSVGG